MPRRGENIHKRKDGRWEGRYIVCYTENGSAKYASVYSRSYAECSEKLRLAKCNLLPKNNPLTVSELFTIWLASKKNNVKPSTYVNYRTMYDNHIADHFGEMRVDKVTSFMINRYVTELLQCGRDDGEGLSPTSVQAILIMLKAVFAYGEIEHKLANPSKHISLPKAQHRGIEVFTQEDINRIKSAALNENYEELGILLCLYTGLRIGELCALQWGDIDLTNQIIHVRKTLQRIKNADNPVPKTAVIITEPKSAKSIRSIPIPTFMLSVMAQLKRSMQPEYYFLTSKDSYTEPRTYQYKYEAFLKRIGIPYKNFHVLRHTFATECIRLGVDVKTVSELLGHSNVKITLERYVHSDMDMKRKQLEKLYSFV